MTRPPVLTWLRFPAGAGIIAVLVWRLGTGAFVSAFRMIDGWAVLISFAISVVTTVFSAWRWHLVARRLGLRLGFGTAVADYYRALFLNAALPGGVLGDVHRGVRHGRDSGDLGHGVRAVVLERTAGLVVLVLVGLALLPAWPGRISAGVGRALTSRPALLTAWACAVAVVLLGLLARRHHHRWRRALGRVLADVRLGLLARDVWPAVAGLSLSILVGHLGVFLVAAHVAGSSTPATRLLPLMVLALMAMALPLNLGGWGPREGVLAVAFGATGLGAQKGLTIAVVYGVLTFLASLPGAGVMLVRSFSRPGAAGPARTAAPASGGSAAPEPGSGP